MNTRTAKFVHFGQGGDVVEYGGGCHCSGYGSPESPHAARPSESTIIPDGTPVLDKRPALDTDEGFSWVFKGPMVDVDLPSSEVSRCPDLRDSIVAQACIAGGNAFGSLAALQIAHDKTTPGPLDYVDTQTYIDGWVDRGARAGYYQDGEIVWYDRS